MARNWITSGIFKRLGWGAVVVVALLAASPAARSSAAQRHHAKTPTEAKLLAAWIAVHNTYAEDVVTEFQGETSNYAIELEGCHNVAASSGETRLVEEEGLRERNVTNAEVVDKLYVPYAHELQEWIDSARHSGAALSKSGKHRLRSAVAKLQAAHAAHEKEFFHMRGIWVAMQTADCPGAEEAALEARLAGTTAWVKEFQGLHELAQLFHVSRPTLEFAFGPYNA